MSDPASDERDPLVWLSRAESCLALAREGHGMSAVVLEDLCFQAQQAIEKALKGFLILRSQYFPKTHDIRDLLTRVEQTGVVLPPTFRAAADLTVYAIMTRYPGGDRGGLSGRPQDRDGRRGMGPAGIGNCREIDLRSHGHAVPTGAVTAS